MSSQKQFTFEISLSVLNHLGRHLYRSFATVLGEAISNSWDADADNVWIYVDRKAGNFFIRDDGNGMTAEDFQHKFLKIGYSKRTIGSRSDKKRPFHGRKGIGKLALLSCAKKISVISKVEGGHYVGGTIDNSQLDKAITQDLTPQQYPLGGADVSAFGQLTENHKRGTIIYFQGVNEGIRSSFDLMRRTIALYFRFSLLDESFKIFLNDAQITFRDLDNLAEKTQFLWQIGDLNDPFVENLKNSFKKKEGNHEFKKLKLEGARGFIASVTKPRDLKIINIDERVGVDLFVNGRLREKDILKHAATARLVENYLYGQIHFDGLDDKVDRFTSSREAIVADDPKYKVFLELFRKMLSEIVEDWDKWRIKQREPGDEENPRITPKERASLGLYGAVSKEYGASEDSRKKTKVDNWFDELSEDASFNFGSYAECFVSENLVRKYIEEKNLPLSAPAKTSAEKWKGRETESKKRGNISIEIRKLKSDLNYLDMDDLANLVDKKDKVTEACLARDAAEYKPIRDAVAHTSLLTDGAKQKLETVRENIKARIKTLLSDVT
jgi:Histidine kinase-, DNA gyrase B-, and HSP90-like ATPase